MMILQQTRGALSSGDQLALDLPFAETKSLAARIGPTPVFTRASAGTFVGSNGLIQSAGNNVARFDHHPITGICRGLLIEESRTNFYTNSEDFSQGTWNKARSSIQTNATTSPDGNTTADKLIEDTSASSTHTIGSAVTPSATPHTLSVFAKKGERNFIVLRLGGSNDFFNLNTGVALTNVNSPTITNYGNGWYRCTVTSSAGTQGSFQMSADGITTIYTGDGTSGIFIWGAQLEAGSFATSYIPTTTASVVRSADVCSIFGTDFTGIWNYDEGTIYAAFDQAPSNTFSSILTAARSDDTGKVQIGRATSSQIYLAIKNNANTETFIYNPTSSITAGLNKSALAYKTNDAIGTINNLSTPLDTSVSLGTPERLLIANDSVGSGRRHNGTINAIRVYKKRLPLSKLQALTV